MNIAGFVPLSTVDCPGYLCSVVFTQGCPLACTYCHNKDIIDPRAQGSGDWDSVMSFLRSRQGLLDGVVFSGGEPLLQADLSDRIEEVRSLGYLVGLHTAGSYPRRLEAVLPLLDWVGLDVKALVDDYPVVTGRSKAAGQKNWESLDIVTDGRFNGAYEIRTTVTPGFPNLRELIEEVIDYGAQYYVLQRARDERNRIQTNIPDELIQDYKDCIESFTIR